MIIAIRPTGASPSVLTDGEGAVRPPSEPQLDQWHAEIADLDGGLAVAIVTAPTADADRWAPVREVLPAMDRPDADHVLRATAVANWRVASRHCPRCGALVIQHASRKGWVCSVEGQAIFPRTDPCVIVAVLDAADRLLLAHARERPDRTYSLVAGFVEAGEALEAAVHREVGEEVGVEVTDLRYLTSQPWPFPASLMAGFAARAVDTPITVDGDEITDAHWFTRPALDAALMEGSVRLPPHFSVARRIVEAWRAGRL